MFKQFIFLSLIGIYVSACSAMPFRFSDNELPKHWEENSPAAAMCTAWSDDSWWKQYHSAVLDRIMEQALAENLDIKASVARIAQADAQARIAGATLLPSIDGALGVERLRQPAGSSRNITGSSTSARIGNAYNAGLSASYEVDFWGKNRAQANAASLRADASRYDRDTIRLTTTAEVANTYFALLSLRERIGIARENVRNAEEQLRAIHIRFDNGLNSSLDVAQQETLTNSQRALLPPLELQYRQLFDAMALLVGQLPAGLTASSLLDDAESIHAVPLPEIVPGLPSELLTRRPDIAYAEAELDAAHADIAAARAQFFPSITLTAEGGYQSTALNNLFTPQSVFWSIGSSLLQPIFRGGAIYGNVLYNRARYEELVYNYRKAVLSAFVDVEDALAAVKHAAEEEEAKRAVEQAAQRAYDLAQTQFKGGVIDNTTLLNTQRDLFSAQDARAQARLTRLQAIVGLYRALGGGWQAPQEK